MCANGCDAVGMYLSSMSAANVQMGRGNQISFPNNVLIDVMLLLCAGVEEMQRQAGSREGPPPDLGNLLSTLLGGAGGRGTPRGTTSRSGHGPGSGGLIDILQSPALQQMTDQIFRQPPGPLQRFAVFSNAESESV